MRVLAAMLAVALVNVLLPKLNAQVDGSGTEISATIRLRDYLLRSQYPETNRLLRAGEAGLFETPLVAGDASAAATISGFAGEALVQGSLQIAFRVAVRRPGFYTFRTHLVAEDGKPLIEALVHRQLKAGEQTLHFLIYGKAIRDAGNVQSYVLPGIVGEKTLGEGVENMAEQGALTHFAGAYRTQRYRERDFTNKVWTSRETRATIERLQREIREEARQKQKLAN